MDEMRRKRRASEPQDDRTLCYSILLE
jgi:hypothetical protein